MSTSDTRTAKKNDATIATTTTATSTTEAATATTAMTATREAVPHPHMMAAPFVAHTIMMQTKNMISLMNNSNTSTQVLSWIEVQVLPPDLFAIIISYALPFGAIAASFEVQQHELIMKVTNGPLINPKDGSINTTISKILSTHKCNGNNDAATYFERLPLPDPNIQHFARLSYQYWQLSTKYDTCSYESKYSCDDEMVRYAWYKIAMYEAFGFHQLHVQHKVDAISSNPIFHHIGRMLHDHVLFMNHTNATSNGTGDGAGINNKNVAGSSAPPLRLYQPSSSLVWYYQSGDEHKKWLGRAASLYMITNAKANPVVTSLLMPLLDSDDTYVISCLLAPGRYKHTPRSSSYTISLSPSSQGSASVMSEDSIEEMAYKTMAITQVHERLLHATNDYSHSSDSMAMDRIALVGAISHYWQRIPSRDRLATAARRVNHMMLAMIQARWGTIDHIREKYHIDFDTFTMRSIYHPERRAHASFVIDIDNLFVSPSGVVAPGVYDGGDGCADDSIDAIIAEHRQQLLPLFTTRDDDSTKSETKGDGKTTTTTATTTPAAAATATSGMKKMNERISAMIQAIHDMDALEAVEHDAIITARIQLGITSPPPPLPPPSSSRLTSLSPVAADSATTSSGVHGTGNDPIKIMMILLNAIRVYYEYRIADYDRQTYGDALYIERTSRHAWLYGHIPSQQAYMWQQHDNDPC